MTDRRPSPKTQNLTTVSDLGLPARHASGTRRWTCLTLLILAPMVGCAPPPGGEIPVTSTTAPAVEYVIGAGDTLDVYVHRSPELSMNGLPVRPDGRISIPLVPDIEAAGRTPTVLSRDLEERLRRFVIDPNVTVIVRSFVGAPNQQIRVIGEATQPRAIPYREGMTLLDVMIDARGMTRYAAGNRADVIRRDTPDGPPTVIRVRLSDLLRSGDMTQDIRMRPGDTLVIPQGWF